MNSEELPADLHRSYVASLVEELGPEAAAKRIGISRATLASYLAGLQVNRGTLALIRESAGKAEG